MKKFLQRNKKLRNRKGFTLIELIVVIVIIGILAAIVVPRLGGFRDSADESANIATARTIASAVSIYHAEKGDFPKDVSALSEYLEGAADLVKDKWKIDTETDPITVKKGDDTWYPHDNDES